MLPQIFTRFYGDPNPFHGIHSWNLLRRICEFHIGPWLCGGDFNEVLNIEEKLARNDKRDNMVDNFREAVDDYGMEDLRFEGECFTQSNKCDEDLVLECLADRCFGNRKWLERFWEVKVLHLDFWCSNHMPLLIYFNEAIKGV